MGQEDSNNTGHNEVKIVRGRVDSLSLYEITETELDILEKGSPNSLYLNFAIFLLSIGVSFLISLLSTDIQSPNTFTVFVVLSVVGVLGGFFLVILWLRTKREVTDVVKKIKKRIAEQDINSSINDESSTDPATQN